MKVLRHYEMIAPHVLARALVRTGHTKGLLERIAELEAAQQGKVELLKGDNLEASSSYDLLRELESRGGHPGALAEAALLCARKSEDYNRGAEGAGDMHKVIRDNYFPLGLPSYAQMLHTKSMRLLSLSRNDLVENTPQFESARDTALDIINYAGFLADWLGRKS